MRIPRFYIDTNLSVGSSIELPSIIHRHAIQVLRLKAADPLILFNGKGGEYLCQIQTAEKRTSKAIIREFDSISRESSVSLTLAQSLIKPEKMDFCIQKSVELGVTIIQPIISKRTVVRIKPNQLEKKLQRWQSIIIAACEQSGRTKIPLIKPPITLEAWLNTTTDALRIMMLPEATLSLSDVFKKDQSIELLVGPEGGFTESEARLSLISNIKNISFGARILRAETAAIAGVSLLQAHSGNL